MTFKNFATKNRLKIRIDHDDQTEIIPGKIGQIYEHDPHAENGQIFAVMVIPNPPRRQYWGYARTALGALGCVITQDGDGEGAATFDPSNPAQLKAAIKAAGIKRRRVMSEKQAEVLARARKRSPLMRKGQAGAVLAPNCRK